MPMGRDMPLEGGGGVVTGQKGEGEIGQELNIFCRGTACSYAFVMSC